MAAYYQEVRQLEDKFDGLKLNHILRRLNDVADELAKAVSDQEPVPVGIFDSDLHKPSIRYEEPEQTGNEPLGLGSGADQPLAPSDPKVMELEEDPVQSLTLQPIRGHLILIASSMRCSRLIKQKPDGLRTALSLSPLLRGSSTREATLGSYTTASPSNRGSGC
jgi:hypothetical protein